MLLELRELSHHPRLHHADHREPAVHQPQRVLPGSHLSERGRRYYEYFTKERRDNYRETTQCNGTKSTQLLSSTNITYNCWVRGNLGSDSCGSPAANYLFICN